jgi:hypothetical protein
MTSDLAKMALGDYCKPSYNEMKIQFAEYGQMYVTIVQSNSLHRTTSVFDAANFIPKGMKASAVVHVLVSY